MKSILGIELSHRNTPISVRERMVFNLSQTEGAIKKLKKYYEEVYILSTCNRLSIYVLGKDFTDLLEFIDTLGNYRRYLSIFPNTETAVRNLFSTSSGLESQVLGEHQITGQIKSFFQVAQKSKSIAAFMGELVRRSIYVSRRVRCETDIGKYSTSLATVGFNVIYNSFKDSTNLTYLVIGTGNMANLVTTILDRSKVKKIYIASHDSKRADEVAEKWNAEALNINDIYNALAEADVVIGGTQGEINLLHEEAMKESKCPRSDIALKVGDKKLFIDFGVPRNFNPSLKEYPNITLYDLDDIKQVSDKSILKRYEEIPHAKEIVEKEVKNYLDWFKLREETPVVKSYLRSLDNQINSEVNWLLPKLGKLSDQQINLINKFSHRLKRKVSKRPLKGFKEIVQKDIFQESNVREVVNKIFNSEDTSPFLGKKKYTVGTRGSKLALTQTNLVVREIRKCYPNYKFELKIVKTLGDQGKLDELGAFTSTLQKELISGAIDFCVHSYKDVPTELVEGLKLTPVLLRADPRDVLISKDNISFFDLQAGKIVGTSSNRRIAQLKKMRPDLHYEFISGNIDKRLKKLEEEDYDAIVLAAAGLNRLKMTDLVTDFFDYNQILPAVAQGVLAVEFVENNSKLKNILASVQSNDVKNAIEAERTFMRTVGGGCEAPIACIAELENDNIKIKGYYANENFDLDFSSEVNGNLDERIKLAEGLANKLVSKVRQREREIN